MDRPFYPIPGDEHVTQRPGRGDDRIAPLQQGLLAPPQAEVEGGAVPRQVEGAVVVHAVVDNPGGIRNDRADGLEHLRVGEPDHIVSADGTTQIGAHEQAVQCGNGSEAVERQYHQGPELQRFSTGVTNQFPLEGDTVKAVDYLHVAETAQLLGEEVGALLDPVPGEMHGVEDIHVLASIRAIRLPATPSP